MQKFCKSKCKHSKRDLILEYFWLLQMFDLINKHSDYVEILKDGLWLQILKKLEVLNLLLSA